MFLTYDVTRDETFANLAEWLKEIQQHAAEDVKIYLIGNKAEMEEEREVQMDRAIEFAKQHAIHKVFETSAKTGDNVEEVFSCAAKELFLQTEKEDGVGGEMTPSTEGQTAGESIQQPRNQKTKLKKGKAGGVVKKKSSCC